MSGNNALTTPRKKNNKMDFTNTNSGQTSNLRNAGIGAAVVAALAALGYGGYRGYQKYYGAPKSTKKSKKPRRKTAAQQLKELQAQNEKLQNQIAILTSARTESKAGRPTRRVAKAVPPMVSRKGAEARA